MIDWLYSHAAMVAGVVLATLVVAKILTERRSPQSLAAWLLLMVTVPWIGLPLYLMFGGRKMRALQAGKADVQLSHIASVPKTESPVERAVQSLGIPPATDGNAIQFEFEGVDAFRGLMRVIESAQERIDYATFIFRDDDTGRAVLECLVAKAKAGCRVRLLVDGFGCVQTGRRFFEPLVAAGGEFAWFSPVLRISLTTRKNLRNHRKMVIADDQRVWAGGRNTADSYLGASGDSARWRDLSFTLEGPAAEVYVDVFEADWAFATGTAAAKRAVNYAARPQNQIVQVVPSGPDLPQDSLLGAILTATYRAQRRIRIVTPYFVPPDSVTQALSLASRRGVAVELLLPAESNHRLTDLAREPHLADLHEAGAKILLQPVMDHAKAIVFDDELAFAGSANMDERSLLLNYEVMAAVYGRRDCEPLVAWSEQLVKGCRPWQPQGGQMRRMMTGLAELAAPLM